VGDSNPVGGSRDTATGHGCPASQPVVLALDGSPVARTTADSGGNFRAGFVVPDRPIGRHWLKARCGTVVLSTPVDYVSSGSGGAVGSALPLTTVAMLGFFVLLGLPILRPGAAVHHP
jgi:hypothetical protein